MLGKRVDSQELQRLIGKGRSLDIPIDHRCTLAQAQIDPQRGIEPLIKTGGPPDNLVCRSPGNTLSAERKGTPRTSVRQVNRYHHRDAQGYPQDAEANLPRMAQ